MPRFNTNKLLDDLANDVQQTLSGLEQLKQMPGEVLLTQPAPGKWSVAQVLEHLNAYNRFYLAEIEKELASCKARHNPVFKPGWFGNYFTKMMQPKAGNTIRNKMSAPKNYAFGPELDIEKVMTEFEAGQKKLLYFLEQAGKTDIGRMRLSISLTRMIKLKMGDVFRFLIAHQVRHFVQVNNTLAQVHYKV